MFKTATLFEFEFQYHAEMACFCDEERGRVTFLSKNYDEIHLTIELENGHLVFHPRWNVKIKTVQGTSKKYVIDINFPDEEMNLDDCPMVTEN